MSYVGNPGGTSRFIDLLLMTEVYVTIGVDPDVSTEEVTSVYRAKIKFAHQEGIQER